MRVRDRHLTVRGRSKRQKNFSLKTKREEITGVDGRVILVLDLVSKTRDIRT
jgi:hypothetical protein